MAGQVPWLTPVTPALWEAKVSGSPEVRSSRSAWPTWQNPISTKNTKISQAWWQAPVITATGRLRQENHLSLGDRVCGEPRLLHFTPAWATEQDSISKNKNKKINQMWLHVPVIPATWEAEARIACTGRQRLQWAETAPLHSSLGNRVRLCLRRRTTQNNAMLYICWNTKIYAKISY